MIDASAFFDKNPCGNPVLCLRPVLQPLVEDSGGANMSESDESVELSDEQFLLASGVLRGFDLNTKDWCR
jgi:hypothetical protein